MKKSDLVSGKHILETRIGDRFLVAGDYLPDIDGNGCMMLTSYRDYLKHVDGGLSGDAYDICKVYEIVSYMGLPKLADNMDKACKLVWTRKPELSETERTILKNVDKKYKYIARDLPGRLYLYAEKPIKRDEMWIRTQKEQSLFPFESIFKIVKWEDEEPTLIADLLDKDEPDPFRWPE